MSDHWTRRRLIQTALAVGAGLTLARVSGAKTVAAAEDKKPVEHHLELFNTHTGEIASVVYKRGAEYDVAALAVLRKVLRDHRSGQSHEMDALLYDQLHSLALDAHREPRFEIISGYRSPETNAAMSSRPGSGVARKSLHLQGRALDVRLKSCPCTNLRDLALAAKQGGVGYYRRSDFVHIDTGAFRTWIG